MMNNFDVNILNLVVILRVIPQQHQIVSCNSVSIASFPILILFGILPNLF